VNASALSDEARRLVLERVKRKLGFERTLKALGIARGSLYNYIHGYRSIPDGVVERARNTWGNTSSTRWCRVSIGSRLLALYGEVTAWTTPLY
jgi:hypothetical protein